METLFANFDFYDIIYFKLVSTFSLLSGHQCQNFAFVICIWSKLFLEGIYCKLNRVNMYTKVVFTFMYYGLKPTSTNKKLNPFSQTPAELWSKGMKVQLTLVKSPSAFCDMQGVRQLSDNIQITIRKHYSNRFFLALWIKRPPCLDKKFIIWVPNHSRDNLIIWPTFLNDYICLEARSQELKATCLMEKISLASL